MDVPRIRAYLEKMRVVEAALRPAYLQRIRAARGVDDAREADRALIQAVSSIGDIRVVSAFDDIARAAMLAHFAYRCAYCERPFGVLTGRARRDIPYAITYALEHVDPLAGGGRDDFSNLVPACAECNARKLDRTPEQWRAGVSLANARRERAGVKR